MERSNDEFWHSSFAQIVCMIDMYADEMQMGCATEEKPYASKYFGNKKEEVTTIISMKEIKGW